MKTWIFHFSLLIATLVSSLPDVSTTQFQCLENCHCNGYNISCSNAELLDIPEFETINGANIVDLSNNEIQEILTYNFDWKGIEQLQFLYFNINNIIYIQENAFSIFVNLEYVDLSHNFLEALSPRLFINNSRMSSLLLTGNILTHPPHFISSSLENLDLSFNKLRTFDEHALKHLPNLKNLDLQANNLVYLDPTIFRRHTKLFTAMSYMAWACNCSTVDLYFWVKENPQQAVIDDPIKCTNKNNTFVQMNTTFPNAFLKDNCEINEDSLNDSSSSTLVINDSDLNDLSDEEEKTLVLNYPNLDEDKIGITERTSVPIIVMQVLVVIAALCVGILLGYFFKSYQYRKKYSHISQLSTDNPVFV